MYPLLLPLPPLTPTESPAGERTSPVRILALGRRPGAGEASGGSLELGIPRWDAWVGWGNRSTRGGVAGALRGV